MILKLRLVWIGRGYPFSNNLARLRKCHLIIHFGFCKGASVAFVRLSKSIFISQSIEDIEEAVKI